MTQRSFSNERYRKDAKIGSTRKSAAKAKPVRKVGDATSTKASAKPAEKKRTERDPNKDWAGLPTSPEINRWRRVWWVLLLSGLALITFTYAVPSLRENARLGSIISLVVLALSGAAIYIDLVIVRRLRKPLLDAMKKPGKKSGKDAK